MNEYFDLNILREWGDNALSRIYKCRPDNIVKKLNLNLLAADNITSCSDIASKLVDDWNYNCRGSEIGHMEEGLVKYTLSQKYTIPNLVGGKGSFDEVVLINNTLRAIQIKSGDNSQNKQNMDGLKKDIKDFYDEHIEDYDDVICIKGCVRGTTNRHIPVVGVPHGSSIQLSGMAFGDFVSGGDADYNHKLHEFINDKSTNNKDKIDVALVELKQRVENFLTDNCSKDGKSLDAVMTLRYTSNRDSYNISISNTINALANDFNMDEGIIVF